MMSCFHFIAGQLAPYAVKHESRYGKNYKYPVLQAFIAIIKDIYKLFNMHLD